MMSALCLALAGTSVAGSVRHTASKGRGRQPAGMMEALHNVQAERIRADVKYLSSDALEGRGTGTRGGELAASYIAKQFKDAGVEAAGDDGSYFQKVPMVGVTTLPETTLSVETPKQTLSLKMPDDIMVFNLDQHEVRDVNAGVIFVGYGITAPEFGWDDYAGADVKGKVLLMLVNEPPSEDPKFFGGKALTYYGRWTYKYEQAARMGAAGVILIHKTEMASYGWEVVRSSWSGERSGLADDQEPKLQFASWVQLEKARAMLADAGQDMDALMAAAGRRGFRALPLPLKVSAHVVSAVRHFESSNVIGKVSGSDPELRKQAVIYTGHYDHLGIRPEQPGDNIYNGALDNATGTAMVIEMARAVAASPVKPKRSMYFAAVTAEEQGLWGSAYLAKHPPLPLSDITLDVNFDAIKPLGIPTEVEAAGYERTTFSAVFEKTAADFHLKILAPEHPENGGYYRSDHFSFAKMGVPAFSLEPGKHFTGHPQSWVKANSEAMDKSYHQPSDEYKEEYDYRSNAVLARFGIALGYRAAEQPGLVQWKRGDEFERARGNSAP
ncbi:MAG: M28 family peptidase [Candidatus Korobacteraceae bacterium]|jgi:Zn-dependent M28 family amino/carboxypeptidase